MCIDGHFSLLEEEAIQKEIDGISWDENLSPSLHISSSIARARDVAGSTEQVRIYLEELSPLFADPSTSQFIFTSQLKAILKL